MNWFLSFFRWFFSFFNFGKKEDVKLDNTVIVNNNIKYYGKFGRASYARTPPIDYCYRSCVCRLNFKRYSKLLRNFECLKVKKM